MMTNKKKKNTNHYDSFFNIFIFTQELLLIVKKYNLQGCQGSIKHIIIL